MSFVGYVIRIRKMLTVLKLITGVPRVWNVPAAFWSCGQMKMFLVERSKLFSVYSSRGFTCQHLVSSVNICIV